MVDEDALIAKFEKDVTWLEKNIPPDDIYTFAHQTLIAAEYFMLRWGEWDLLTEECKKSPFVNILVNNIVGINLMKKGKSIDN